MQTERRRGCVEAGNQPLLIQGGQLEVAESWLLSAPRQDPNHRDAHAALAELYRAHTGREYSVCQCWDCEAIASALESCVVEGTLDNADVDSLARQVGNDVQYYRAVEHARRRKVDPPNRRIAVLGPEREA